MIQYTNEGSVKIYLYISCRRLKNVERLSKSDPFVEVYRMNETNTTLIGKTEVVWNQLNPDFTQKFELEYIFEEQQHLRFKVFDAEIEEEKEVKGELIGETFCTIGEIVTSIRCRLTKELKNELKHFAGNIILRVEQAKSSTKEINLRFRGNDLSSRSCLFSMSSLLRPYFCLSRKTNDGNPLKIYKSKTANGKNPEWETLIMPLHDFCLSNFELEITFDLYDECILGDDKFIGTFQFSIFDIRDVKIKFELNSELKDLGTISVSEFKLTKKYKFLEYVKGGLNLRPIVAIDFTGSNGNHRIPGSLHYLSTSRSNDYQLAIKSVLEIILEYNKDKLIPLFGFGAIIGINQVAQCFPLNMNPIYPYVNNLQGVLDTYRNIIPQIEFAGPSHLKYIIDQAQSFAANSDISQLNQEYYVLIILTDGEIEDMDETIESIVRSSNYPLSILIIGIGNNQGDGFGKMKILDSDNGLLKDKINKVEAKRDIVQFVSFSECNRNIGKFREEVLAEIPREVENYFKMKLIKPNREEGV